MNEKTKARVPALYVAAIILLTILLVISLFPGLYARFKDAKDEGESAEVALFLVGGDLDREALSIGIGEEPSFELGGLSDIQTATLPFYITTRAEVAIGYSVKVDFGVELPSYLTVTLTDGTRSTTINADGATSVFSFDQFGNLAAFHGGDSDPDLRVDFELILQVTDSDLIVSEIHLPSARLSVTVEQLD